jgi:hypothetical protein
MPAPRDLAATTMVVTTSDIEVVKLAGMDGEGERSIFISH